MICKRLNVDLHMTIEEATKEILSQLNGLHEPGEAKAITDIVMEHLTRWKKMDRIIHKKDEINSEQKFRLQTILDQLHNHRPVQYVLHEAWFMGMKLYVDENVLIPRPETEELVEWLVDEWKQMNKKKIRILDVGTGSGCIPIALKRNMSNCEISACDISKAALKIAEINASAQNVFIRFLEVDFLNATQRNSLDEFDCIISNPPYIPGSEKRSLQKHVVDFEPHLALFVPDEDPLIFYSSILDFARNHVDPGGMIFLELHEILAEKVAALFNQSGFSEIELKKDMHGKNRMLKVRKN